MANKFDEWFPQSLSRFGMGCNNVHEGEDGEHGPYSNDL